MTTPNTPDDFLIELLALDLDACGRCKGTAANLDAGVAAVADVLRETGVNVRVVKHVVRTADEAERLRFTASPTIRLNGRDIAADHRESECRDCGGGCGCAGVTCRVWAWRGQEYPEAPKAMIVDTLLRAYSDRQNAVADPGPYRLPDNLRGFFAGRAAKAAGGGCCEPAACGC
ncbi:MAG TPA: DUF2703 domain-containing protein [Gemmataceae bacterium]|jgi:hypothetical protein|nr:DUF2703 domain-containing protein [Gemmataceae bacterium]